MRICGGERRHPRAIELAARSPTLAFGVTTSHDPSNDTETVFTNIEMIRARAQARSPPFLDGHHPLRRRNALQGVVETYEDALSHLRRMKAVGAFSVKSYNQQRRDARQMIIKAASELKHDGRARGRLAALHGRHDGPGRPHRPRTLAAGAQYLQRCGEAVREEQAGYTPTLIVGYGGLSGEYYWYQHSNVWENRRLLTLHAARCRRSAIAPSDDGGRRRLQSRPDRPRARRRFSMPAGSVQLGAHGQLQGLGAHWELWMFAQGGMTPYEALQCATINGARYLGLDHDLGTLEKGKLADLVVLDRNPLENIRNSDSVRMVMINGRLYDAATMDEIGNRPRKRAPFYWEREKRTETQPTVHRPLAPPDARRCGSPSDVLRPASCRLRSPHRCCSLPIWTDAGSGAPTGPRRDSAARLDACAR